MEEEGWDFEGGSKTANSASVNEYAVNELTEERDMLFDKLSKTTDLLRKTEERLKSQLRQAEEINGELEATKDKLDKVRKEKTQLHEELERQKASATQSPQKFQPTKTMEALFNPLQSLFSPAKLVQGNEGEGPFGSPSRAVDAQNVVSKSSKSDEEWEEIIAGLKEDKEEVEQQAVELKTMYEQREQDAIQLKARSGCFVVKK